MTRIPVTLVTAEGCHYCAHAREVLARLAREWPLEVTELAISSPAGAALAIQDGIAFAPGVYLNGEYAGYGRLSEGKLRQRLAQLVTL